MGGRGASSMKNNHDRFVNKMIKEAGEMTRGDLQGVIEAYAMKNGLDSKWENEVLDKIDKSQKNKESTRTIDGQEVLDTAMGYDIWLIGRNAPDGYVGLIKGRGESAKTAYIKSQYADEFNRNLTTGRVGVNGSARVLNAQIKRTKTKIEALKSGKMKVKGSVEAAIRRNEKLLAAQELTMKLRRDIYKY